MASRTRPEVVTTRVKPDEKRLIRALAAAEDVSVAEAVHRLLVPAARRRLAELAQREQPAEVA